MAPIVTISVDHGAREQAFLEANDPVEEVNRLLQTYGHMSDVTVSIRLPEGASRVRGARVQASRAWLRRRPPFSRRG